jgi:HD-like signal output (HDOD) protein
MAVVTKRLINDFQGKIGSRILERLWEHALSSAVAAREVARASRFGEVELAFTGGLLHNIGEVVLLRGIAEVASSAGTEFPETLTIEVLDRFHAPIGGKVLRAWRLPEPIPTIAEYHHEPEKAPENFADSVAIVHLADLICAKLRLGLAPTGDEDFWKIAAESAQRLGIGEVALAATEVTIEDLRGEIQTIL